MELLLYILRHGETDYNLESRIQGQRDTPLNQNGIRAAELTGKALGEICFDRVISSPLTRAKQTAEIILSQNRRSRTEIETDDRLMEISFGEWEGRRSLPELNEIPEELFRLFLHDPMSFPGAPGGETVREVIDRTNTFLRELLSDEENGGKTILLSTHGCAMRALLQMVYGDGDDFWHGGAPKNCALNIVLLSEGRLSLIRDDILQSIR